MGTATQIQAYHYKNGDRPLEGFTIHRGVGRGAFGEVYYALSDSGREVAIKSILGYEQIELRGVSQCMNLKSPYLVSIFDIRQNDRGQNFVVMEYVAGPSLRDLLNDSPSGLGAQKTAFFLREIAKGLTYLHDRGIVHRDLKPGNIFYEDGYVKIGDYGLSKAIAPSQHSGQTITVGTVHYMAPEIGQGRYDKSIDVYALGVLVFEMLTGHVPFFGASHGEILMKHLMETPDVSGIEEPFATVIRKAMAKDPAERYQSVQEMVEAIFGADHIAHSVSVFRPDSLSMVAERVARNVVPTHGLGSSAELANDLRVDRPAANPPAEDGSDIWLNFGRKMEQVTEKFQQTTEELVSKTRTAAERVGRGGRLPWRQRNQAAPQGRPTSDPMTRRQRRLLGLATALVMGVGTAFLWGSQPDVVTFAVFGGVCGGAVGLVFANRRFLTKSALEQGVVTRLVLAVPGFIGAGVLSGVVLANSRFPDAQIGGTYAAMGATFLLMRWDRMMAPHRRERVMLGQAIAAGLIAFVIAAIFEGMPVVAMGIMAGIALVTQIASPFVPAAVCAKTRGLRTPMDVGPASSRSDRQNAGPTSDDRQGTAPEPTSLSYQTGVLVRDVFGTQRRTVPIGLKIVWLCILIATLGLGLFFTIGMSVVSSRDFPVFLGGAMACGVGLIMALIQIRKRSYLGVWGNLVKPLLLIVSLTVAVLCGMAMAESRPGSDDALIFAFAAAFSAAVWLVLLFIPSDFFGQPRARPVQRRSQVDVNQSELDQSTGILLCCLGVFGIFGLHRFYVGKIGTGLLYLFTAGLLFVGQIYDFFLLVSGEFTDARGRKLKDKKKEPVYPAHGTSGEPGGPPPGGHRLEDEPAHHQNSERQEIVSYQEPPEYSVTQQQHRDPSRKRFEREPRRTSFALSTLGYAFLIPGVIVGAAVAFQVPLFAKVGMPFPELGQELDRLFEYGGWPGLVSRIGTVVSLGLLIISALLLVIARREAGVAHVSRAVLGIIGLFLSGAAVYDSFHYLKWLDLLGDTPQLQKLETVMNQVDSQAMLIGTAILLAATVLISWPERRRMLSADSAVREGVAA